MALSLPPLVAELTARTDRFEAEISKAAASAQKAAGNIEGAFGRLSGVLGGLGIGAVLYQAADAARAAVTEYANLGDDLFKMSQRVGVSVESLSTLRYAADLSGVGMEDLDTLLGKLNKRLAETAGGSEESAKFLAQFGITAREVKEGTLDTEEALKRIADRFATAPDGITKSAASYELMGKSAARLIPFLNQGREGIVALQEEATKLGLKLSTEAAKQAEAFNDQLRTLEFASEGAKNAIIGSLMPSITKITQAMRDATLEGGRFAGFVAGVSTYKYGSHMDKNDADLVKWTEKKLQLEKDIEATRAANNPRLQKYLETQLQAVEEQLRTTMAYRGELEKAAVAEATAARIRDEARKNGKPLEMPKTAEKAAKAARSAGMSDEEIARRVAEAEQESADIATQAWSEVGKKRNEELTNYLRDKAIETKQVLEFEDQQAQAAIEMEQQVFEYLKSNAKDVSTFARDMGLTFSSAFEDAVIGGEKLSDVLAGLARDIQRIVFRKTITEPLGQAVTDMIKGAGGGNILGDIFQGLGKFLGFRADGGPVQGGGAYWVGERGPELFVPGASGSIVPNHAIGGAHMEVNIINNAGGQVDVRPGPPRFDGRKVVRDVVVDLLRTDGAFRQSIASSLRAPAA